MKNFVVKKKELKLVKDKYIGFAVLPDGIEKIARYGFYDCRSLQRVNFPDSLTTIEEDAFANCLNLNYVKFPKNIKYIGNGAFRDCKSLNKILVPNTEDAKNIFSKDNLKNIGLSEDVEIKFYNVVKESEDDLVL